MTTLATRSQDAAERRRAVRTLLRVPLITSTSHPDDLVLVRRHAAALQRSFGDVMGYALVVEAGFARLVKDPLDPTAPVRPALRSATDADSAFTPRGYAVLALVAAAVCAPRPGDQLLISTLVDQVRTDAVSCGIDLRDALPDRRLVVAAVELLERHGFVAETDGSVAAWADGRQPEALLTIDRALLPHLLAQPLRALAEPAAAWATRPESPRRRLRRRLLENPVLARDDLDDDERDVLSRERSELTRVLDEFAGLVLEVRAEGALLYDPESDLTDVEFPGTGSLKQAALLVLGELSRLGRPGGAVAVSETDTLAGVLVAWPDVDAVVAAIAARHATAWRKDYVQGPGRLRDDVIRLLSSLGLTVALETGLAVRPAAARYRPEVTTVGRRPAPDQPDLFAADPTGSPS